MHAIASIRYRADQVVVGIAINLLAIGITRFFLQLAFDSSSNSPRVNGFGAGSRAQTGDNPLVWLGSLVAPAIAFAAVPDAVRAAGARAGEKPEAAAIRRRAA